MKLYVLLFMTDLKDTGHISWYNRQCSNVRKLWSVHVKTNKHYNSQC